MNRREMISRNSYSHYNCPGHNSAAWLLCYKCFQFGQTLRHKLIQWPPLYKTTCPVTCLFFADCFSCYSRKHRAFLPNCAYEMQYKTWLCVCTRINTSVCERNLFSPKMEKKSVFIFSILILYMKVSSYEVRKLYWRCVVVLLFVIGNVSYIFDFLRTTHVYDFVRW